MIQGVGQGNIYLSWRHNTTITAVFVGSNSGSSCSWPCRRRGFDRFSHFLTQSARSGRPEPADSGLAAFRT